MWQDRFAQKGHLTTGVVQMVPVVVLLHSASYIHHWHPKQCNCSMIASMPCQQTFGAFMIETAFGGPSRATVLPLQLHPLRTLRKRWKRAILRIGPSTSIWHFTGNKHILKTESGHPAAGLADAAGRGVQEWTQQAQAVCCWS